MHGSLAIDNNRKRLIEGALRFAEADRSDPFTFNRAMSEIKRGLCNGSDKFGRGFGYDAEPYITDEMSFIGKPIKVRRFKNMQKP